MYSAIGWYSLVHSIHKNRTRVLQGKIAKSSMWSRGRSFKMTHVLSGILNQANRQGRSPNTVSHVTIFSRVWGVECPISLLQTRAGAKPSRCPTAFLISYIYQHHKLPSSRSGAFLLLVTVVQPCVPPKVSQHSPTPPTSPSNKSLSHPSEMARKRTQPTEEVTDSSEGSESVVDV